MSLTQQQKAERCVLPLEQAYYRACKDNRGVTGEISELYGINYNTLAAQINPNNTTHTLTPENQEYIIQHTKDPRILDSICHAYGNAGWFELPQNDEKLINMDIAKLGEKFVEMNNVSISAVADGVITQDELAEIEKAGMALIAKAKSMIEAAKKRVER